MNNLAVTTIVAVFGILLMTITSGDCLCVGDDIPDLGDNSVCLGGPDNLATLLCRLRCIVCHLGKVETPYGCLKEGENGKTVCHCIAEDDSATPTVSTPTTTTLDPTNSTGSTTTPTTTTFPL